MLLESAKFTLYQQLYASVAGYDARVVKNCPLPALLLPYTLHSKLLHSYKLVTYILITDVVISYPKVSLW